MTAPVQSHTRKIILAASCFADASPAIKVGTSIASGLNGDIHAMLIEEDAILRYAGMPFAKALMATERSSRNVTPEAMSEAFSRDARTFEMALSKAAKQVSVRWTFERRRGQTISLLREMVSIGDLVLIGHERADNANGDVVLLDITDPVNSELLRLGLQLAQQRQCGLRLFAPTAFIKPIRLEVDAWRRKHARTVVPPVTFEDSEDTATLLTYLAQTRPVVVLVSSTAELGSNLSVIAETARCPVLAHICLPEPSAADPGNGS